MPMTKCKKCGEHVSTNAKTCPQCGAPVRRKSIVLRAGCLFFVLLAVLVVVAGITEDGGQSGAPPTGSTTEHTGGPALTLEAAPSAPLPVYHILETEPFDGPGKTAIEVHATVSGDLTEAGLRALLDRLYREADGLRDFAFNDGRPTQVFIYLYTSKAHYDSKMGQWIAMLMKSGKGEKPEATVHTDFLRLMKGPAETRFGLSEEQRLEVFQRLVQAEDRAASEAQERYPLAGSAGPKLTQDQSRERLGQQMDLVQRLEGRYKDDLARENGLTREQVNAIALEGTVRNWPLPPR